MVGFGNGWSNAADSGVHKLTPREKLDPRGCPINYFRTEGRDKEFGSAILTDSRTRDLPGGVLQ